MSGPARPSNAELVRQTQQHIDSLRAAGVEWIPRAAASSMALNVPATSEATTAPEAIMGSGSFFEDRNAEVGSPEQRCLELTVLAGRVAACSRCTELAATRTQTVFGVGRLDPEICFIGEAPGADEDAQGEPFVGAAGQLLNRIIAACGMKREEVYICNILKCRPPGNRLPMLNEAACSRELLER